MADAGGAAPLPIFLRATDAASGRPYFFDARARTSQGPRLLLAGRRLHV